MDVVDGVLIVSDGDVSGNKLDQGAVVLRFFVINGTVDVALEIVVKLVFVAGTLDR